MTAAEIAERWDWHTNLPGFRAACALLAEWLTDHLGEGDWPLAVLCEDGCGWAFAVLPFDPTSYINDGRVEWYGTSWVPGCECGDLPDGTVLGSDDDHVGGCPALGDR